MAQQTGTPGTLRRTSEGSGTGPGSRAPAAGWDGHLECQGGDTAWGEQGGASCMALRSALCSHRSWFVYFKKISAYLHLFLLGYIAGFSSEWVAFLLLV